MDTTLIAAVTVVAVALIVTVGLTWFFSAQSNKHLMSRIADLEQKIGILSLPVQKMNAAVQVALVRQLTHFHTPEIDQLLAKLGPPFSLSDTEMIALIEAMKQREVDVGSLITEGEREAARMLPMIIRRVAEEKLQPMELFDLILVAVPRASADDAHQ